MASRMVSRRQKFRKFVAGSVRAYADTVHTGLAETLTPLLQEGETLPDFALVQKLLLRLVRTQEAAMVEADGSNEQELGGEAFLRRRRDELLTALYTRVVEVRLAAAGVFGSAAARELMRLTEETSRDPEHLILQARQVIIHLRNPDVPIPAIQIDGIETDLETWISRVEAAIAELTPLLEDVETDKRVGITVIKEKQEAIDSFDSILRSVAQVLRGCFTLGGLGREAERLRLQAIRRRVAAEEEDDEGSAGPQEPSSETPTPPVVEDVEVN